MKIVAFLLVVVVAVHASQLHDNTPYGNSKSRRSSLIQPFTEHLHPDPKGGSVFGGQDAEEDDFPFQVALFDDSLGFFCSGSIISTDWIVTAGHCVDWTNKDVEVRAGLLQLTQQDAKVQTQRVTFAQRTIHPHYHTDVLDNDIALIKLTRSINIQAGLVEVVNLPSYADTARDLVGFSVFISGWGRIRDTGASTNNHLQFAELKLAHNKECEDIYGNAVIGTKLCATTTIGVSTCKGDSGGPIVHAVTLRRVELWGIVSFGSSRGCTVGRPVVFTRVSHFLGFIETVTGIQVSD